MPKAAASAARGVAVARGGVAIAGAAWGDVERDVELREEAFAAKGEDVVIAWLARASPVDDVCADGADPRVSVPSGR